VSKGQVGEGQVREGQLKEGQVGGGGAGMKGETCSRELARPLLGIHVGVVVLLHHVGR
jgi:hypothetical protein